MDADEIGFRKAILADPATVAHRLAFADWLEERGRLQESKYLKEVRRHRFVREVERYGGLSLTPPWKRFVMPPVPNGFEYYQHAGDDVPAAPSPRMVPWVQKIESGWRVPSHIAGGGYYTSVTFFGVWVWEYLRVLSPLCRDMSPNTTRPAKWLLLEIEADCLASPVSPYTRNVTRHYRDVKIAEYFDALILRYDQATRGGNGRGTGETEVPRRVDEEAEGPGPLG